MKGLTTKEYALFKVVQLAGVLICFTVMKEFGPSACGWTTFESWIAAVIIGVIMQNLTTYIMKDWVLFQKQIASQNETEKEAE